MATEWYAGNGEPVGTTFAGPRGRTLHLDVTAEEWTLLREEGYELHGDDGRTMLAEELHRQCAEVVPWSRLRARADAEACRRQAASYRARGGEWAGLAGRLDAEADRLDAESSRGGWRYARALARQRWSR